MKTLVLTSLIIFLSACGSQSDQFSQSASRAKNVEARGDIVQGDFKVYLTSRQIPDASCDVYTKLVLSNGFVGPMAVLTNASTGSCDLAVNTAQRSFNLTEFAGDCGTRHYRGSGLEVTDNRTYYCDDAIKADVIVKEQTTTSEHQPTTTTFYSFDPLY